MTSSLLGCIPFQALSLLMLQLRDMKLNVSLSIECGRTSCSSLSSSLSMGMNITHSRIERILTRILLGHIGKRADGLERCRLGVPWVGTALVCHFLYLNLWFRNWFGFHGLEYWNFYIFMFWAGTQLVFIFGDESCASTYILWLGFHLSCPLLLLF